MKLALLGRQALMGVMAVALVAGMSAKTFADEGLLKKVKDRGTLLVGLDTLMRVTSNPFFPYMKERIEAVIGGNVKN